MGIGPYGAKGVSEAATVSITPAILNAISNAIGVRINQVPASPKVILEAIQARCAGHGGSDTILPQKIDIFCGRRRC